MYAIRSYYEPNEDAFQSSTRMPPNVACPSFSLYAISVFSASCLVSI